MILFVILARVILEGTQLQISMVHDVDECKDLCDETNCDGFTIYANNSCLLYDQITGGIETNGSKAESYNYISQASQALQLLRNKTVCSYTEIKDAFMMANVSQHSVSNIAECGMAACDTNAECFSWVPNSKECYGYDVIGGMCDSDGKDVRRSFRLTADDDACSKNDALGAARKGCSSNDSTYFGCVTIATKGIILYTFIPMNITIYQSMGHIPNKRLSTYYYRKVMCNNACPSSHTFSVQSTQELSNILEIINIYDRRSPPKNASLREYNMGFYYDTSGSTWEHGPKYVNNVWPNFPKNIPGISKYSCINLNITSGMPVMGDCYVDYDVALCEYRCETCSLWSP